MLRIFTLIIITMHSHAHNRHGAIESLTALICNKLLSSEKVRRSLTPLRQDAPLACHDAINDDGNDDGDDENERGTYRPVTRSECASFNHPAELMLQICNQRDPMRSSSIYRHNFKYIRPYDHLFIDAFSNPFICSFTEKEGHMKKELEDARRPTTKSTAADSRPHRHHRHHRHAHARNRE
eukprot:GHVU01138805.1.p1 GENE.GHVU01138805.1~~GHVU01138805.1.p1  ORF type:complete len:181 (-),score=14.92 GHVU01138805.1:379-921(-)